ncbi:unnamed protein product [Cunninghamella echinulata]
MNPFIPNDTFQYAVPANEDTKFVESQILNTLQQGATNTTLTNPILDNTDFINDIKEVESLSIQEPQTSNSETEKTTTSDETIQEKQPSVATTIETEKTLSRDEITAHEESNNREWFEGKPAKTPERYKTIRNYILEYWQEHKPNYVSKTNIRRTMKNPGDVNAVGRVHHYLESNGYINVGCPISSARPKKIVRKPRRQTYEYKPRSSSPNYTPRAESGSRKRKTKADLSTWDDPDLSQRRGTNGKRKRERKVNYSLYQNEYDPYELIEMEHYDEEVIAPFKVHLKSEAMMVMDFHSHLVLNEVIGLLGGTFETKEDGQKLLTVECVFPCKSVSTDIQCEMDPVSEMQAREWFEKKGYRVVGWYHSHPTFLASPSVRDIETQMSYQDLFKDNETDDEPFIGIIVNPYDNNSSTSEIACLHISKEINPEGTYRLPYICDKEYIPSKKLDTTEMITAFESLVTEYKFHQEKVDMSSKSNNNTNIEQLLSSLDQYVHLDDEPRQKFKDTVETLVRTKFMHTCDN